MGFVMNGGLESGFTEGSGQGSEGGAVAGPRFPLLIAACALAGGVLCVDWFGAVVAGALATMLCVASLVLFGRGGIGLVAAFVLGGGVHFASHILSPSRPPVVEGIESRFACVLVGEVRDVPWGVPEAGSGGARFRVKLVRATEPFWLKEKAEILVNWKGPPPSKGDQVEIRAELLPVGGPRNPGEFDRASYWKRKGIWMEASPRFAGDCLILRKGPGWSLEQLQLELARRVAGILGNGIEERFREHQLVSSMVLGIRGEGLAEMRPVFQETGTLHIFAVSGFNLALLSSFLGACMGLARVGERVAAVGILTTLFLYAFLTGMETSCVRAFIMSAMALCGVWFRRPSVPLNALGCAACFLLFLDTNQIFQTGFQLSFFLTWILLVFAKPVGRWIHRFSLPDPLLPRRLWTKKREWVGIGAKPVSEALAVTFVSWLATVPWAVFVFGVLSFGGVIANLFVIPLANLVLLLGFMSVVLSPIAGVSKKLNQLNAAISGLLYEGVRRIAAVPFLSVPLNSAHQSGVRFLSFDLSKGGSVALLGYNKSVLFDCGSELEAQKRIIPGLRSLGASRMEALFLSHGSVGYIGGAIEVYNRLGCRRFFESSCLDRSRYRNDVRTWLTKLQTAPQPLEAGESVGFPESVKAEVLYPAKNHPSKTSQDKAMVIRWSAGDWSLLYSPAIGFAQETWMLEHCPERLASDIWVTGWNSRDSRHRSDFLRAVSPKVMILQRRPWEVPLEVEAELLEACRSTGTEVFEQAKSGAVLGELRKDVFRVREFYGTRAVEFPIRKNPSRSNRGGSEEASQR